MERFITILTVSDQTSADIACDILENAGVSVMLEYVSYTESHTQDFKILVPQRYEQRAATLVKGIESEPISSSRTRARKFSGEWLARQGLN